MNYTTTMIAKEYGLSAQRLHSILKERKIIEKVGSYWRPVWGLRGFGLQEWIDCDERDDILTSRGIDPEESTQKIGSFKWTEKGKNVICALLDRWGYQRMEEYNDKAI